MISIIIPACNEENYIKDSLDSISMQDYKDYEIIVVCNGCTDKTEAIAKKYTKKVFNLLNCRKDFLIHYQKTCRQYGSSKTVKMHLFHVVPVRLNQRCDVEL